MPPKNAAAKAAAAAAAADYADKQREKHFGNIKDTPHLMDAVAPFMPHEEAVELYSRAASQHPPAAALPAAALPHSRWPGPVNLYPTQEANPFADTVRLLYSNSNSVDPTYSLSSENVSSDDSQWSVTSVTIPESEFDYLLQQPEDFGSKKPKQKKSRRNHGTGAGAAAAAAQLHEPMLVFNNGQPSDQSWPHIEELIAGCSDIFGDDDPSSSFNPRDHPSVKGHEDEDEETVKDQESDPQIIEARKEMFGLLLGQLLSIEDEIDRYTWFKDAYEKSKRSLENVFRNLKLPDCLQSPESKKMLTEVLGKLFHEGKEYNSDGRSIPSTRNRKINQAFLDSKSSSATTIRFQTKEEFVIFILSIYADSIHDANRIEDTELKTKVVKLKKACARNFVAKMYPRPQSAPIQVSKLLEIIERNGTSFETELMDHYAKISGCIEINPFDLATALTGDVVFTDNASMNKQVTKDNSVLSIQTLLDAGASNRGNLCFFDPYNVRFIWEEHPGAKDSGGEYYEFLVNQTVSIPSHKASDCQYFALDHFKRLSWRTRTGSKVHKKAVVERLPLCTIQGEMDGCFTSIMLRHVAERVWQQAVKSVGEPDGLSALPLISLKWSGDSSMGIEELLGFKNICGSFVHREVEMRRRLPYIVSTDTAMLSGNIQLSYEICKRYNNIVEQNNTGNTVNPEDLAFVNKFIDDIEVRRALISNDRSAHGGVILLLGATLKMRDSPVNPHCKSILVCSGNEMVNINEKGQIIRTMNRTPSKKATTGSAADGRGVNVDSSDDESVAGSCRTQNSQTSYVGALSFYLRGPNHVRVTDTQEMVLSSPSASPPPHHDTSSSVRWFPFSKKQEFIDFLKKDDRLTRITESTKIPDVEFDRPDILAVRLNAEMARQANTEGIRPVSEKQYNINIKNIEKKIKEFNESKSQSKGGGFFTRSRSRSRNHHRTRYTNKRKHRSNKKSTIKHRKSYRKHKNTIKRHNIEK